MCMTVDSVSVVAPQRQTGGAGKAIASAFIPGLGQFCDGRNKEGAKFMGASVACGLGSLVLKNSLARDMLEISRDAAKVSSLKGSSKFKIAGLLVLGLATTGLWIANIVDAYKGGKNKA